MSDGVPMDEDLIKIATGQYDVGLPSIICLSTVGLRQIACLDLCTNLTDLDLSHNRLSSCEGIQLAPQLIRLNLSFNQLTRVDQLGQVSALEILKIQANNISEIDALNNLRNCSALRGLYLQDKDGTHPNPVCQGTATYGADIMKRIPQLRGLDGHYFYKEELNPKKIDGGDDEEIELPKSTPWIGPTYFPQPKPDAPKPGNATEKQFRSVLADCQQTVKKAK